ncbi:hypothetical protein BDQ12DRAFT_681093 [Crucibulum laeve]|uniref:histidine kinase n=1 Tax=Crucibulum laeve TaxID=68775 RepID=A0A5C3M2S9_9AGAR|nr:hypothetical protein BDQ12DRAFT_681093 [Crucibulum laeve]
MPRWFSRRSDYSASSKWTEEVANPVQKFVAEKADDSERTMTTPITATAVDDLLPVPVLQSNGNQSVASRRKKTARVGGLTVHWARLKKRIGTGTAPSSSSFIGESAAESSYTRKVENMEEDQDEVNEVVVDRVWSEEIKSSITHSEHGGSPEKSGSHGPIGPPASDHESIAPEGFWTSTLFLAAIRYRMWPTILTFFNARFMDEKSERHYAQESWFLKKPLALWASAWLIINWALGCAFIPKHPIVLMDKIFYFGIAPVLSFPVPVMVMYDWPRDRAFFYQSFMVASIWMWSIYQVLFILLCGYYSETPNCQGRDFLGLFYYTSALQTIALFGLKLNRFTGAIGALTFFLFTSATMIPLRGTWGRSMINFFFFQAFLIYIHYMRESSERRLYTLRDQLKIQYKATQKAQINERKAADSKRRLTSYVFHEVRVPLNTALLAVQNMEASGTVVKDQEIEFNALSGSLSMMSKVLNDVLDFNRMDSGKFESASRPYPFHQVMRSLFIPLRLATDARGLKLETDLDVNIDKIARRAAYEAMGESMDTIRKHIHDHPDVDGVVTGDETRLRQIITNLASNACKFTPQGGKLSIKTRLIVPTAPPGIDGAEIGILGDLPHTPPTDQHTLSASHLSRHNLEHGKPPPSLEWIVVRIEVTDTGYGIKPRDMAQSKLFSAFNQTEQGRQQGGKGTGLGLALVRQIVKLSGGRLGVQSRVGEGSTFWVELPLGVGRKTLVAAAPYDISVDGSATSSDVDKVRAAAAVKAASPDMNDSITMAVDAAALMASRVPSVSARTNAAMHSIMEQGGRVELVLNKHASGTPIPTRTIGDASTGTQFALPISTPVEEVVPNRPSLSLQLQQPSDEVSHVAEPHKQQDQTQLTHQTQQRPTYVPLPSPRSFSLESQAAPLPTSSTMSNFSQKSGSSSGALTMFDSSFQRGSPASSQNAINIEPGMSVLVVDDDPLTRTLMKRILTRLGCTVSVAENGEVALELILGRQAFQGTPSSDASGSTGPILEQCRRGRSPPIMNEEGKYAVVFLDNQMPVMSGLKTVEKLRELGRNDFIVGVTGNALLTDQREYLDAGVDRVLTKPVLERSLRDILIIADERRKFAQLESPTVTELPQSSPS